MYIPYIIMYNFIHYYTNQNLVKLRLLILSNDKMESSENLRRGRSSDNISFRIDETS